MRDDGVLPRLSSRLGELTRTNSEAIVGAMRDTVDPQRDFSRRVAITPPPPRRAHPHRVGPLRAGQQRGGAAENVGHRRCVGYPRWRQLLRFAAGHPIKMVRLLKVRRWSERTVILLVMQNLDNSRVFAGNTADPSAFVEAVDTVRDRFGLGQLVWSGPMA